MAIRIEKNFVVKASPDEVWAFLIDPYRVARCLPGAAVTEQVDDKTYAGKITVKVGPVSSSYKGKLRFDRLDPQAREAELSGSGMEVRGKGGADMRMTSRVLERAPGEAEVKVSSEINVTGVMAQFGRGMIQDVSDEMFQRFAEAMRAELESGGDGSARDEGLAPGAASEQAEGVANVLDGNAAQSALGGGLPDCGIATDRRQERVPGPDGNREIEGRNHADDAVGVPLFIHAVLRAFRMHGQAVHHAGLANCKIADIDHFLHFAITFGFDLAHFQADQAAQGILMLAQGLSAQTDGFTSSWCRNIPPVIEHLTRRCDHAFVVIR